MIFKDLDTLIRFILNGNINLEHTDITFDSIDGTKKDKIEDEKEDKKTIKESYETKIVSLFDKPKAIAIPSDENIIFVEGITTFKDLCGSGKINLFGREIMTNICNYNEETHIDLSIDIEGKIYENIKFKVSICDKDTKDKLYISKELLNGL